ncbi:GDP-mannose 4,6 dehydratase [Renibacterium salmoninarum ATCC 33209]|uniref:GDP-mannose 4,6-dehydratase n=1 Tax=Renibacterium salmoninarum (strain ATCC 33209 / DSM 20767 / JCM 11484 / NBRC 15589 / NCIMB 2235) TaxID=288705 RepID=A9WN78_RENSM|nr:GDP-mannose 4,6-dehydratase [Renibacterium salmoninarum]ABY23077.1 GDP-mannose 4,6 dehydratase [Renibacterium salmoninarum ATCC 33209]
MSQPSPTSIATDRVAFITGVRGQDGSYLAESLVAKGWKVHGLVRETELPRNETLVEQVELHQGDLSDSNRLRQLILDLTPDAVFNLGGISSVATSWKEPYQTALISGASAIALMDASLELQNASGSEVRFFQASSAEIFGHASEVPQVEGTALAPLSPYGVAKAMAHRSAALYRSRGLLASTGILYNHESTRRPPSFVTRKISLGVAAIALGMKKDLILGNLNAIRDFGWAPDCVRAMELILESAEADDYIIASGESHSIREFVLSAFEAAGIANGESLIRTDPLFARPLEAPEMRGEAKKISDRLGWSPTTRFHEIARNMVEHDLALLRQKGPELLNEA